MPDPVFIFRGHRSPVTSVVADDVSFYSSDQDGFLISWNRRTRKRVESLHLVTSSILGLFLWNTYLLVQTRSNQVLFVSLPSFQVIHSVFTNSTSFCKVSLTNSTLVVIGSELENRLDWYQLALHRNLDQETPFSCNLQKRFLIKVPSNEDSKFISHKETDCDSISSSSYHGNTTNHDHDSTHSSMIPKNSTEKDFDFLDKSLTSDSLPTVISTKHEDPMTYTNCILCMKLFTVSIPLSQSSTPMIHDQQLSLILVAYESGHIGLFHQDDGTRLSFFQASDLPIFAMDIEKESKKLLVGGPFPFINVFSWNFKEHSLPSSELVTSEYYSFETSVKLVSEAPYLNLEQLGIADVRWVRQGRACLVAQSDGSVIIYHIKRKIILAKLLFPSRISCSSLTILSDTTKTEPLECLCTHQDGTFSLWSLFH